MKKIIFLLCVILISSTNSIELVDDVDDFNNTAKITTTNSIELVDDVDDFNNTAKTTTYREYKCIFYEHQKCNIIDNIIFGIINSNITIVCFLMWYTLYLFMKHTCCVYNKSYFIKNVLRNSS